MNIPCLELMGLNDKDKIDEILVIGNSSLVHNANKLFFNSIDGERKNFNYLQNKQGGQRHALYKQWGILVQHELFT